MVDVQKSSTHVATHTRHSDDKGCSVLGINPSEMREAKKKATYLSPLVTSPSSGGEFLPNTVFSLQVFGELYRNLSRVHPQNLIRIAPENWWLGDCFFGGPGDFSRGKLAVKLQVGNMQIG